MAHNELAQAVAQDMAAQVAAVRVAVRAAAVHDAQVPVVAQVVVVVVVEHDEWVAAEVVHDAQAVASDLGLQVEQHCYRRYIRLTLAAYCRNLHKSSLLHLLYKYIFSYAPIIHF